MSTKRLSMSKARAKAEGCNFFGHSPHGEAPNRVKPRGRSRLTVNRGAGDTIAFCATRAERGRGIATFRVELPATDTGS
jgi:hypothetical protein